MVWVLLIVGLILVASFMALLRGFNLYQIVPERERGTRIVVIAGSIFVATATVLAVLLFSDFRGWSPRQKGRRAPDVPEMGGVGE